MSKYLYIFDPGHGGLVNGKYVTPGKRSPKFPDGSVLYEGVNNRDNVKRIMAELLKRGIDCVDIVNSNVDISLSRRVASANALRNTKSVYISIHSDAAGDGVNWHPASGLSVYTSKGNTKSDKFAEKVMLGLRSQFGATVKYRTDTTDGDQDKEEDFYVLKNTSMPAILCELGFHTNKEEAARMLTDEWKNKIVNAIVSAILAWEAEN